MSAVEILFSGSATGAVAAAEETSAAIKGVGATSAVSSGELGKLERGALAGSGALSGLGRNVAYASAAFVGAAGLVGAIKGAVDQSEKLQKATDSARVALERQGANVDAILPKYQATAKAAAEYGQSEADAMQGLARATLLTGSAEKAQRAYNDALVISKATGKDFNAVLTGTSKAQDGSTTSLARYGIMLPKVTTAQDALKASNDHATKAQIAHAQAVDVDASATEASRIIMQRFGGQAAANTTQMDRLRANAANLGAELGGPLLAALNVVAGGLSTVLGWVQKNRAVLEPFAAVIGITAGAWAVFEGVVVGIPALLGLVSGAVELLTATMYGLPILGIVALLATLAVALVELWQHSQRFRDIVLGTWNEIRSAAAEVWGAIGGTVTAAWHLIETVIRTGVRLITDVIRIGLALIHGDWSGAWNAMKALAGNAIHGVVAIIRGAIGLAGAAARLLGTAIYKGILQPLGHLAGELLSAIKGALSSAIHTVAGWVVGAAAAIGHAIASGILGGIGNLAGDLASKLKDAAGGALGAVKGALHIGSPSRVFADEVGAPIAQGIIAGFLRDIAPLSDTMRDSLTPTMSSGRVTTPGLASSAGAGVGLSAAGGGPTYHYTFNVTSLASTPRGVAQELGKIVRNAPRSPAITVVAR